MTLTSHRWREDRPNVLVVACSDGRLQEVTDDFLATDLGVTRYDRFYAPGGAGALAATGRDFSRARQMRQECKYLVELHQVGRVILLFHGPAETGPPAAICADYKRKLPFASAKDVRAKQSDDARELLKASHEFAGDASVDVYRCEVHPDGRAEFVEID